MLTETPRSTTAPTYSAYERLPDGRERVVVASLRYTQMLAWRPDGQTWAVEWRQDMAPSSREP